MRTAQSAAARNIGTGQGAAIVRGVIAWAAVAITLVVAIAGAVQGGSNGLAIGVSTVAGGATEALGRAGQAIPFGYAFAVGMASAVNPCGFALLPTYLGLYLGNAAADRQSWPRQLRRALLVSLTMTGSFVFLFGAAGVVLDIAGAVVGPLLPWLSVGVGVLLVLAAGRMLSGGSLAATPADRIADSFGSTASQVGLRGYAAYGLAFALSSLGCTLPLFLTVVGAGLSQTQGGIAVNARELLLYALGMGTVVSTLTVLVAFLGRGVFARVRGASRAIQPLSAVLLLATGGYLVYYWLSAGGIL